MCTQLFFNRSLRPSDIGLRCGGFRDSVKFVCKLSRISVFGIEASRTVGMWWGKFDMVRIERGGGHISEGIQSGGDELVVYLHIVMIFLFCLGGFCLSVVHARLVMDSDRMSGSMSPHN